MGDSADIHLPLAPVLSTVLLRVSGSEKFRLSVFWKREGNLCGGDEKKVPKLKSRTQNNKP